MEPSRRLEDCEPALKAAWEALSRAFHAAFPGWTLVVTCTHRPPELQLELFKIGRRWNVGLKRWVIDDESKVVTHYDGYKLHSRHSDYPARAIDAAVVTPGGDVFTDPYSRGIAEHEEGANPWVWLNQQAPFYGLRHGPDQGTFCLA